MSFLNSSAKSEYNDNKRQFQKASENISHEFKSFLCDVENLYKATSSLTGDDLAKAKAKLSQRIQDAKEVIGESSENVIQRARKTATITNNYVHDKPWAAIGVTAAASLVVGLLLARRD